MAERPGCLAGFLKLAALGWVYDWLQDNFGFGRGCSGAGCGLIFLVLFIAFACYIITTTNWFEFGF